jgi:hypothetical protein
MKVISDDGTWITAVIEGRWCQAKVFNEPSTYGLYNGRVSKLAVSKTDDYNHSMGMAAGGFHACLDYHYDRGFDLNHMADRGRMVRKIVKQLEAHRLAYPWTEDQILN